MEDLSIIGLIIGLFKYFDYKFDKKIDDIKNDIKDNQKTIVLHEHKIDSITRPIDEFQKEFKQFSINFYQKVGTTKQYYGNPISAEEKQILIRKFADETITKEEAQKLKEILEEEQKDAEKVGNNLAVIAIGLMLIVVGYFLYKLMEGENK